VIWGTVARLIGHKVLSEGFLPEWSRILVLVLSVLAGAFWLGGRLLILLGRKMREKGLKLP
jgi:putative copper export protein